MWIYILIVPLTVALSILHRGVCTREATSIQTYFLVDFSCSSLSPAPYTAPPLQSA